METPLKIARKQVNLSQQELAEKIEVTQHAISQWETGKRRPTMDKAIKLARVLKTDVETLFGT